MRPQLFLGLRPPEWPSTTRGLHLESEIPGAAPSRSFPTAGCRVHVFPYEVVLLSAPATEHNGQKDLASVTRLELLATDGQEPVVLRLKRCENAVAPADELVQSERQYRETRFRIGDLIACQK